MILTIPDEFLEKNQLSSQKIKQDIAMLLFEKCSLTLEQASLIAEIPITEFKVLVDKKPSLKPFSAVGWGEARTPTFTWTYLFLLGFATLTHNLRNYYFKLQ